MVVQRRPVQIDVDLAFNMVLLESYPLQIDAKNLSRLADCQIGHDRHPTQGGGSQTTGAQRQKFPARLPRILRPAYTLSHREVTSWNIPLTAHLGWFIVSFTGVASHKK